MKKYTIRCYDREEGKREHDHILCKGVEAQSAEQALDKVMETFWDRVMVGDDFYAEEDTVDALPKPARKTSAHAISVGRECAKRAAKKYGPAWRYLSEEQRKGAISIEVVSAILSAITMTADTSSLSGHCMDLAHAALWPEENKKVKTS